MGLILSCLLDANADGRIKFQKNRNPEPYVRAFCRNPVTLLEASFGKNDMLTPSTKFSSVMADNSLANP
jgi:hypothetical protein